MKKVSKLNKKQLVKRINYKLTSNFYSLEEIQKLNKRQLFKVIKIISKIEKIQLSRKEIKEIVIYLQSDFQKISLTASKLWNFTELLNTKKTNFVFRVFKIIQFIFYSSYRMGQFELMRN